MSQNTPLAAIRLQLEQLRVRLRQQLLRDLLHGVPPVGSTLEELNSYYGYQLRPGTFLVLMIRLHFRAKKPARPIAEALEWVDEDVRMFLTPEHFQELETLQEGDCLYCMLNFTSRFGTPESEQTRQSVDRLYRHMDIARRYRPYYFAIGDGLPVSDILELGSSFLSARQAVEEYGAHLQVNRRHDSTQQMYTMTQIMNVLTPARRSVFAHYLETIQRGQLERWVDEVFEACRPYVERFPTICYQLPYKILDLCLDTAGNTVAGDPQLQQILLDCRGAVDIRQDYSQLADVVKEGLRRFCDRYAKSLARAGNPAVQEARRFMWEHYARRLTLGEIAAHVHLNPQYFSVLFKRETGQSVVDHLTHLRLEQAKCLLKDTSLPINQVAGQVGYEDPDYFSRLFHKVNGMSPRQYRGIVGSG